MVVLIVEDEPALQETMKRALEHAGFMAHAAFDCRRAIACLDATRVDVVCIDLCLPDQSGYELCEHIRRTPAYADVLIVVMADRAFPEHMVHAEAAGANAFLEKPFRGDGLVRCIESLFERAPASTTKSHLLRMP